MRLLTRLMRSTRRYPLPSSAFASPVLASVIVATIILSLPSPMLAGEKEVITIVSSSTEKNLVLVNAKLNGKLVQMECFLSESDCSAPKEGDYVLVRLAEGEGRYMDCTNVHVYEKNLGSQPERRVGEYCFLGE